MALILGIETATQVCSVSLARAGEVLNEQYTEEANAHSAKLALLIRQLFEETGIPMKELQAVAVSKGPGSYTGLRIGVSTAKGLCYGLGIPLISVSSLRSLAAAALSLRPGMDLYCPMLDARRMEVYTALYQPDLNPAMDIRAVVVDRDTFAGPLESQRILFFGNGAGKCMDVINHPNALFDLNIRASANNLAQVAYERYRKGQMEDLAYFEPYYLKDFIAGKPRVKGLFD